MLLRTEFVRKIIAGDINNDLPEDEYNMLYKKGLVNHGYRSNK